MTPPALESRFQPQPQHANRRRNGLEQHALMLDEIDPALAIDRGDDDSVPLELLTFGGVRELCPECKTPSLKLVLRQKTVRLAHLFCAACGRCFDAHYSNGVSALTI